MRPVRLPRPGRDPAVPPAGGPDAPRTSADLVTSAAARAPRAAPHRADRLDPGDPAPRSRPRSRPARAPGRASSGTATPGCRRRQELRRQLRAARVQMAVVGLGAPLQDHYALAAASPRHPRRDLWWLAGPVRRWTPTTRRGPTPEAELARPAGARAQAALAALHRRRRPGRWARAAVDRVRHRPGPRVRWPRRPPQPEASTPTPRPPEAGAPMLISVQPHLRFGGAERQTVLLSNVVHRRHGPTPAVVLHERRRAPGGAAPRHPGRVPRPGRPPAAPRWSPGGCGAPSTTSSATARSRWSACTCGPASWPARWRSGAGRRRVHVRLLRGPRPLRARPVHPARPGQAAAGAAGLPAQGRRRRQHQPGGRRDGPRVRPGDPAAGDQPGGRPGRPACGGRAGRAGRARGSGRSRWPRSARWFRSRAWTWSTRDFSPPASSASGTWSARVRCAAGSTVCRRTARWSCGPTAATRGPTRWSGTPTCWCTARTPRRSAWSSWRRSESGVPVVSAAAMGPTEMGDLLGDRPDILSLFPVGDVDGSGPGAQGAGDHARPDARRWRRCRTTSQRYSIEATADDWTELADDHGCAL